MLIAVIVIISVIVVLTGAMALVLFLQNQKPQLVLGMVNGKFSEIPNKQNSVSTETVYKDKLIEPLKLKGTVNESKEAMKKAFVSFGRIEIKQETDTYIYAVATTEKMKFHDDIEIYFDEKNGKIQYRSASRAGYGDMGVNRDRYNKIAKAYEKY